MPDRMEKARAARKSIGYSAAKRRLADSFCRALLQDFDKHGDQVIAKVRDKNPDIWLRLMAQLVPQTLELQQETEPMTLEQAMAECIQFLVNLPPDQYNLVQSCVDKERLNTIPEHPVIEHRLDS